VSEVHSVAEIWDLRQSLVRNHTGESLPGRREISKYLFIFEFSLFSASWPELPEAPDDVFTQSERQLMETPFVGPYADLMNVIHEAYIRLGRDQFVLVVETFLEGRPLADVHGFQTAPKREYSNESIDCDSPDEFFLYDPGVIESAGVSEEKLYALFAVMFRRYMKKIVVMISHHEKLKDNAMSLSRDGTRHLTMMI
jgi:hypothetical protein